MRPLYFKEFIRDKNPRLLCHHVDSLSTSGIQYLLTKGLITGDLGAHYYRVEDIDTVYLLLTTGSSLQPRERIVYPDGTELELLHYLNVIPFSLTSRQQDLRSSECDDVVMYDNFDKMPFIDMFYEASNNSPIPFSTWLARDEALRGWMTYLMVSGDELTEFEDLAFSRDDVLYGVLTEDVRIYEYLLSRGIRFSRTATMYLMMGMSR